MEYCCNEINALVLELSKILSTTTCPLFAITRYCIQKLPTSCVSVVFVRSSTILAYCYMKYSCCGPVLC
jgi:hypothetical protein